MHGFLFDLLGYQVQFYFGFHANPTLYSGRLPLEEQKMIGSLNRGETIKKLRPLFPHKAMLYHVAYKTWYPSRNHP